MFDKRVKEAKVSFKGDARLYIVDYRNEAREKETFLKVYMSSLASERHLELGQSTHVGTDK